MMAAPPANTRPDAVECAFAPTDAALRTRPEQIDPHAYRRTRNYLNDRVTRLSPS